MFFGERFLFKTIPYLLSAQNLGFWILDFGFWI